MCTHRFLNSVMRNTFVGLFQKFARIHEHTRKKARKQERQYHLFIVLKSSNKNTHTRLSVIACAFHPQISRGKRKNVSACRHVQTRLMNSTLLSDGEYGRVSQQNTCRKKLLDCIHVDENSNNRTSFPLQDACMDEFIC